MALSPQRRYQNELARYGLGLGGLQFNPRKEKTLFAEEGPASALSGISGADNLAQKQVDSLVKRTGLSPEEVRKKLNRGIGVTNLPSDVSSMPELAKAYAAIMETVRPQDSLSLPDAAKIEAMPDDSPAFAESPLDAIANMIKKAERKTPSISDGADGPTPGELLGGAVKLEAEEKTLANQEASFDRKAEDAFVKSVANLTESDAPTTSNREELIEKYKQEFADATGLKIDGNVDRSDAMIAFGLELMKNKAGKGFNVGKIASAVGEAGTTALPILRQAKKEATAAQMAAGKFALQKIATGEVAAASLAKERRAASNALNLKLLEIEADLKKEEIKAGAKGSEYKNVKAIQPVKDLDIHYGIQDGQTVLAKATGDASRLASTFNAYSKAQVMLNQMQSDLEEIAAADSPTLFKLESRINNVLIGFGLKDAQVEFGDDKISLEDRVAKGRQTLINEFKRALLQESQVSDLDLNTLFKSLGEQKLLDNPNAAVSAIANMKGYFANKKAILSPIIMQFRDEYYYKNTEEYKKAQEILDTALNKRFSAQKGVANEGRTFLDITQEGNS